MNCVLRGMASRPNTKIVTVRDIGRWTVGKEQARQTTSSFASLTQRGREEQQRTPAPGHYDVEPIVAQALCDPSFRSATPRQPSCETEAPGPGAYDQDALVSSRFRHAPSVHAWAKGPPRNASPVRRPEPSVPVFPLFPCQHLTHAAHRKPTGEGAREETQFGGRRFTGSVCRARTLPLGRIEDLHLGVPDINTRVRATPTKMSSSFASVTDRDMLHGQVASAPTPGPGQYESNAHFEDLWGRQHLSLRDKEKRLNLNSCRTRFAVPRETTSSDVGPGTYEFELVDSVRLPPRRCAAVFGTTEVRGVVPESTSVGIGSYDRNPRGDSDGSPRRGRQSCVHGRECTPRSHRCQSHSPRSRMSIFGHRWRGIVADSFGPSTR